MESYQGYFVEQDRFVSTTPVRIPLRRRTVVTVYDEPADDYKGFNNSNTGETATEKVDAETAVIEPAENISEEIARKLRRLDVIDALLDASPDEEVPEFERANLHREVRL